MLTKTSPTLQAAFHILVLCSSTRNLERTVSSGACRQDRISLDSYQSRNRPAGAPGCGSDHRGHARGEGEGSFLRLGGRYNRKREALRMWIRKRCAKIRAVSIRGNAAVNGSSPKNHLILYSRRRRLRLLAMTS
jgi:hypothetical protein